MIRGGRAGYDSRMNRSLLVARLAGLALLLAPMAAFADTEKAEAGAVFAASKSTRILDAANPAGKVLGSPPTSSSTQSLASR